ncbi:drug/metabolite transporter (DMT)-like permease [Streptomyces aurantiacus]|uniref:DMT family transporter n=1 Tax=Streptomyces aurantiacus TaxID=47760 RepID=UPI0027928CC9|nr:DMT family transporter [Streptomyces aurantiacus]MDQ0779469.1 drug/metabolite transporter (DMT)-like permease [Streptomyces aurantiacus]
MNILLSIAFVGAWSSGFIGAKLGAGSASPVTLLMWRFLPLALVLGVVALTAARASWRGLGPRDLLRQAVIGMLSQSGYLLTVYYAIQLGVSSGTTALIDGTQPLVAGALAGPLLGMAVSRTQWLGLGLGVAGVAVVTTADAGAATGVAWWAYLVPFVGMLCMVAATFLDRRARADVRPMVSMTIHAVTSAVAFTALAAATGGVVPPADGSFWTAVVWLVVLSTFGGYGLYWLILRRSGVTEVNTLMFLMAPVTAVWGALMFGEPFGTQTVVGLALGLLAVAVVHRGDQENHGDQGDQGNRDRRDEHLDHGDRTVRRRSSEAADLTPRRSA